MWNMQEGSYMSFENYVDEMRKKKNQAKIEQLRKESDFAIFLENSIREAMRYHAESAFITMKAGLAEQIISNPQNQSFNYEVPREAYFLNEFAIPSQYQSPNIKSKIFNELGITVKRDVNDNNVYYVKLLHHDSVFLKTKHFNTFYTHLQYLAEKDGFHLSECIEISRGTPYITITYQRTITPQGTITNQRTIPQPVTNAPKENENGSSKPNRLARAGDIIETLLLYSWVGLIVVALIIFFLCR